MTAQVMMTFRDAIFRPSAVRPEDRVRAATRLIASPRIATISLDLLARHDQRRADHEIVAVHAAADTRRE